VLGVTTTTVIRSSVIIAMQQEQEQEQPRPMGWKGFRHTKKAKASTPIDGGWSDRRPNACPCPQMAVRFPKSITLCVTFALASKCLLSTQESLAPATSRSLESESESLR
jgi:hypothetical protein